MPTLYEIVEEFKDRVNRREQDASETITKLYRPVYNRILDELDAILAKIQASKQSGKPASNRAANTESRLRQALIDIAAELTAFDIKAISLVNAGREDAVRYAIQDSEDLVKISMGSFPESVNLESRFFHFDKEAARDMIAKFANEDYVKQIIDINVPEALKNIQNIMVNGIAQGLPPREAARQLAIKLDMPRFRATTTARTEILNSYRAGNIYRYNQTDVTKAWQWSATLDDRTCPVCVYMDGQIFSLDTPFATHPDCRCSPIPVTKSFKELGINIPDHKPNTGLHGEEWFRSISKERQFKILGKKKFQLYESHQITLGDLTHEFDHPRYGPSREEYSIKDLKRLGILHS